MQQPLLHTVHDQHLWLSADRAIYWEETKTLILSDLHFGKTGHFRKSGIAVPQTVYREDLQRLMSLLVHFKPERLLIVGDFFHSHANAEMDWFSRWRNDMSHVSILLVKGNHDILKKDWYEANDIKVVDQWQEGPFLFSHEPCEAVEGLYLFCGHLHPGILLAGAGKQYLRLPCFYFTKEHCILPAFSRFTGLAIIEPKGQDKVFALAAQSIISLQ